MHGFLDKNDVMTKILTAKNSPDNRCYAEEGEIMSLGTPGDNIKRKLPKDEHFFVGLTSRQGSRYAWVTTVREPIAPERLREMDRESQKSLLGTVHEQPSELYETLLAAINRFYPGTPMAAGWIDILGLDVRIKRKLQVHRVFFRGGEDE